MNPNIMNIKSSILFDMKLPNEVIISFANLYMIRLKFYSVNAISLSLVNDNLFYLLQSNALNEFNIHS